jgi:eukaryotic-like serine/threonine-protein kinase
MEPTTRTPHAASPPPAPSAPDLVGETFGDFRILRQLGQGGMGEVYLAEQVSLRRKVAIKMLKEHVAANPTALERFKAESKTVAQLSHANVVQVHTVGEHQGRRYMVLEYVEGMSLRDYLTRKGPLDVMIALSIMRQVAAALHRASEMGIVHRDIKPENILLTRKGEAKVADFGLSRCFALDQPLDLTRSGTTVGTPLYMSPEQAEGKVVDYRSDIYSFGATCYHMLSGKPPFGGSNAFEVALKHVREEPAALETTRPDLPAALCAVVRKMMAKKPHARYQSAHDLLKDVARVRESLSGTTGTVPVGSLLTETVPAESPATPAPAPARKRPRRRARRGTSRWVAALVAVGVLVALLAGGAIAWHRRARPADAAPPAPDRAARAEGKQERDGAPRKQDRDDPPRKQERDEPVKKPDADETPSKQERDDGVKKPERDEAARKPETEEALRKVVEQHLRESSPNPNGVDACIDLGVLYLDQNRFREAEALFKRMDERPSPSAYHFVGRLGLAVTDALKNDYRASHAKFLELVDPRSRDNRVQILNDYLAKNPEFARWVNEAEAQNVRNGIAQSSLPQGLRRPAGRPPFRRP